MALRTQKPGKPDHPWTLEELRSGLEHFYKEYGKYPTAPEVDKYIYLPSARSIERRFGGLVELRKTLKLGKEYDFRAGSHSKERAHTINNRAHGVEKTVYESLTKHFGKEFVHREYFYTDDKRSRADFFIYDGKGGFCVDVFYPSDKRNLIGCVNSKLRKYESPIMREYPVIFLQMNENIEEKLLNELVQNKKKPLQKGQYLMGWEQFKEFIRSRNPLNVLRHI